jgi:hypothetical protein
VFHPTHLTPSEYRNTGMQARFVNCPRTCACGGGSSYLDHTGGDPFIFKPWTHNEWLKFIELARLLTI